MKKRFSMILVMLVFLLIPVMVTPVSAESKSITVTLASKKKTKKTSLTVGDKLTIKAKKGNKVVRASKLSYKSSKKSVASVNWKGVVTAKKAGTAKITITTKNKKKKAVIQLTVNEKTTDDSSDSSEDSSDSSDSSDDSSSSTCVSSCKYYALSATAVSVKEGESETISLIEYPDSKKVSSAEWSSSNKSIATVSDGKITGVKAGSCFVYAKYNGRTHICIVRVTDSFDADVAKEKLVTTVQDSGNGVALIITNKSAYYIAISGNLTYKDSDGAVLQTVSNSTPCVDPGATIVLWFNEPFVSSFKSIQYKSFEYKLYVNRSNMRSIGSKNIAVEYSLGSDSVTAKITNKSSEKANAVPVVCLFYDKSGKLIGHAAKFADCRTSNSTDSITFKYPRDDDGNTIKPASCKIYVNGAYS